MSKLREKRDRLVIYDLLWLVWVYERMHKEDPDATTENRNGFITYALSNEVLRFFFGDPWTNENVSPVHLDVSKKYRMGRAFLETNTAFNNTQFRHTHRVMMLAELLFNSQGAKGIGERIALMKNGNLESAIGELECASFFLSPKFAFRFITPTGTKEADFEAEVTTISNRKLYCEIKTKSKQTPPTQQTLWRSLDKARQQLPKNQPGMVVIRIPGEFGGRHT